MPLSPLVYVCVMSSFNLPEWEACLLRRPSDVVLLVSSYAPAQQGAERMARLLEERLPGVAVHRPDRQASPLAGDDALAAQDWLSDVLVPYLERAGLAGKPRWLNMTGGTKSMLLALLAAIRWDQLDYKPVGGDRLQAITLQSGPLVRLGGNGQARLPAANAHDVAKLYNSRVTMSSPNPLTFRPASRALAERLYVGLAEEDTALDAMFEALTRVWVDGQNDKAWKHAELTLDWSEFLPGQTRPDAALMAWLQAVEAMAPECWSVDARGIRLPGNARRNGASSHYADLKDWLKGDWWEQLAYHWLRDAGLPETAIARNIHGGEQDQPSSSQREADLLVHFRGRTTLVEIKVNVAPGQSAKEMETQVSSLTERFGMTQKVLLVSPLVRRRITAQQWQDFKVRCHSNQVRLCSDRHTLLEALDLTHGHDLVEEANG